MTNSVVWVTGARGFIGKHLAGALAKSGAIVLGLGHGAWPERAAASCGLSNWLNGDISPSNLNDLRAASGRPDAVYHLAGGSSVGAAIANPREDFVRTVASTVELLEWARQESPETQLIAVSSAAVYGSGHDGLIGEAARINPFSPYGHHKAMMESLFKSYGATYGTASVIARLFSVYGPGLRKQLLWDTCCKLALKPPSIELGGSGDEIRDWTYVGDAVAALIALTRSASAQATVVNVGSGRGTSVREIAQCLVGASHDAIGGMRTEIVFTGRSRPGDPFSLIADVSQLNALGVHCEHTARVGIQEYVDWFAAQQRHSAD